VTIMQRTSESVPTRRGKFVWTRWRSERGQSLLETALTLPLLLLISVGIFEFGRAYQTWQIVTNAAREGARVAVLPTYVNGAVEARVQGYLTSGQLPNASSATVVVNRNTTVSIGTGTAAASSVTVNYPFQFIVLGPVARLVVSQSTLGAPLTMSASAVMRNESQ
jgi:Flp pilus assembly protein TadG